MTSLQALPSASPSELLGKTVKFPKRPRQKVVPSSLILLNFCPGSTSIPLPGCSSHNLLVFCEFDEKSLLFSGCELAQMFICILPRRKSKAAWHRSPSRRGEVCAPCGASEERARVCSSKFKLFLQVELLITVLECFMTVPIHRLSSATRHWNSTG